MNKYLLTIVTLFITLTASAEWKPFINQGGVYKLFDEKTDIVPSFFKPADDCHKGSFNYYTYCLGYATGEVITYFADNQGVVALNAFNKDVLFALPMDESKTSLTQKEVDKMMAKYEPKADDFTRNLQLGLKKKSIRQSYVEKTLGIKAIDNVIKDNINGYTYIFNNGVMVDYKRELYTCWQ